MDGICYTVERVFFVGVQSEAYIIKITMIYDVTFSPSINIIFKF